MRHSSVKKLKTSLFLAAWLSASPLVAQSIASCMIATKDGNRTYRTDTVRNCSVNLVTGETYYTFNGNDKQRQYQSKLPLSQKHIRAVKKWQKKRLRLGSAARSHASSFKIDAFLQEAAKAKSGYVLVRTTKKGKRKLNIVFVTNGIYRYVDLDGQSLNSIPSGLMVAGG